jgi:hypothetical protein
VLQVSVKPFAQIRKTIRIVVSAPVRRVHSMNDSFRVAAARVPPSARILEVILDGRFRLLQFIGIVDAPRTIRMRRSRK